MAAELLTRFRRSGLTLLEVVVSLAIVAILGAVVFQNLSAHIDRQRVNESIVALNGLRLSVYRFDSAVGRFPRTVTNLHTPITNAEPTICTALNFSSKGKSGGEVGLWGLDARGGPFYHYNTPQSGFPIGIGMVSDTFTRDPATAANDDRSFGLLQIVVRGVTDDDVTEANLLVDRDGSSTNGAVRWIADGSGTNTMTWNIPIPGC